MDGWKAWQGEPAPEYRHHTKEVLRAIGRRETLLADVRIAAERCGHAAQDLF